MKKRRTLISLVFVLFLSTVSYSQALSGFFYELRDNVRRPQPLSYPRKVQTGIVYTLNGKRTSDTEYVRRVLSGDHLAIDTLLVGLPGRGGRREMIIDYRPESSLPKP